MRIYPSREQKATINKTIGCCRFVYNHMLGRNIKVYERRREHLSYIDMQNMLPSMKKYLAWLKEADSQALKYACRQLSDAFSRFFGKTSGFPEFKSKKHSRLSYTTTNSEYIKYFPDIRRVQIPCLGTMRCAGGKIPDDYKILRATVSCKNGKYYVSILYETEKDIIPVMPDENQVRGLDYKSDGLYVTDEGYVCNMPHWFRESERKLRHEQRNLSRKLEANISGYKTVHGKRIPVYKRPLEECRNIQKQLLKVALIHEHIANQRLDFLQKESLKFAESCDAVCLEDIDMKTLSNTEFGNGKATLDNGFGMFRTMLEYKLSERGKRVIKVDKWFPSSQTCSHCGYKNPLVKDLHVKKWTCPECGTSHDRDVNAAVNIRKEGLRMPCAT